MLAKIGVVEHVYDIVRSICILLPQLIEYVELDDGLVEEALLVPYDLDGHMGVGLVVQGPDHLPEAALANHLQNLVAKGYVVVFDLQRSTVKRGFPIYIIRNLTIL